MKALAPIIPAFRKLNMFKKIIALYICLIFLPSVITIVFYYGRSSALIEQEYNVSTLNVLNQTANNVGYYLRSVTNSSNVFISNPQLYHNLDAGQAEAPFNTFRQLEEMREDIASIESNTDVFKVRIFVDPSIQYAREKVRFFSIDEIRGEAWFPEVLGQDGKIYWISTYIESYLDEPETHPVITAARIIRHPNHFEQVIGMVLVDMKEELIAESLDLANLSEARSLYVVDSRGRLISHPDRLLLGEQGLGQENLQRISAGTEGFFKQDDAEGAYYMLYRQIPYTDWRIVAEIPVSHISSENKTFTKMSGIIITIITFIVFFLFITLFFAMTMRGMNRRMKHMSNILEREGGAAGAYAERLDEDFGVLHKLERNILRLVENVRSLTEETYRAKLQERELYLRALQAQINPHFLYNTLERINWMAISRNAQDISQVIGSLSTYFRLTLNRGRDIVELRDELRLSEAYLDIQKNRFGDQFDFRMEIDRATLELKVPKLTLQPVIENALLHGIRKKQNHRGTLIIKARLDGDILHLEVQDDGIGMTEEQLAGLGLSNAGGTDTGGTGSGTADNRTAHNGTSDNRTTDNRTHNGTSGNGTTDNGSYGLYNVNERIRLFAGNDCGVTVHSGIGIGTRVIIRLKAMG
ncbi:MAG: hypothetical protein K0R57_2710 [Paenibacillaceae bacterium]|jgi:two-component system sensor histidine kinase YesM|nr:hypothetical protein [Paenibacillaceae bacterium]